MTLSRVFNLFICLMMCLTLATSVSVACPGGDGNQQPNPLDLAVFGDQPPRVPGVFVEADAVWGIPPKYWDVFEGTLQVLDITGSVTTFFVPGAGWMKGYKMAHGGVKALMAFIDKNKRSKVSGILGAVAAFF